MTIARVAVHLNEHKTAHFRCGFRSRFCAPLRTNRASTSLFTARFELRRPLDESKVLEVAKVAGLDVHRLKIDMQGPDISARLGKNTELAQALGITGTPSFAVGDKVFSAATNFKSLQAMIEEARRVSVTR